MSLFKVPIAQDYGDVDVKLWAFHLYVIVLK